MNALAGDNLSTLEGQAKKIRRLILEMIYRTKSPHIGSSFSAVEILVSLYFNFLNINQQNSTDPNRDYFILSKGHACAPFYAALFLKGLISEAVFKTFATDGSAMEHHPNYNLQQGIEVSTGSLGHGLSISAGLALANKNDGRANKVCVLLSEGDINEGSTWEAIMFAAQHRLSNLIAIVDHNKIQALGYCKDIIKLESLSDRFRSFGWQAQEIDGHNFLQIEQALNNCSDNSLQPKAIVAHTIKGKGVSFMEDKLLWHYRCPDEQEYLLALNELA